MRGHRRSIRLPAWDYRTGWIYFATIVTHNRAPIFGTIVGHEGEARLAPTGLGRIAEEEWLRSAEVRSEVKLDKYVLMPNHLHGIVWLTRDEVSEAPRRRPLPRSLGALVGAFKSASSRRINQVRGTPGGQVWQRNYYERVIRDDRELEETWTYIANNPVRWADDPENPARRG